MRHIILKFILFTFRYHINLLSLVLSLFWRWSYGSHICFLWSFTEFYIHVHVCFTMVSQWYYHSLQLSVKWLMSPCIYKFKLQTSNFIQKAVRETKWSAIKLFWWNKQLMYWTKLISSRSLVMKYFLSHKKRNKKVIMWFLATLSSIFCLLCLLKYYLVLR